MLQKNWPNLGKCLHKHQKEYAWRDHCSWCEHESNIFFRIFQSSKISSSRPFAHYRYYIPSQGSEKVIIGLFNQLNQIGVKKIKDILDNEIRPAIAMDGGDCEFAGFQDGILTLRLLLFILV